MRRDGEVEVRLELLEPGRVHELLPPGLVALGEVLRQRARQRFDHVAGGLVCGGAALTLFQIAGQDRRFLEAGARIDGDTVVVSSPDVPEPVAVRFAWEAAPEPNLFNADGLPASPFRTDNWPRDDRAVETGAAPR